MPKRKPVTIEIPFRCKFLCEGCKTIEEMAKALEAAAAELRQMQTDGVELMDEVEDDYPQLTLVTSDPKLIEKYKSHEVAETDSDPVTEHLLKPTPSLPRIDPVKTPRFPKRDS